MEKESPIDELAKDSIIDDKAVIDLTLSPKTTGGPPEAQDLFESMQPIDETDVDGEQLVDDSSIARSPRQSHRRRSHINRSKNARRQR